MPKEKSEIVINKDEDIPDPLENIKKILGFIIYLISIYFTKIFPILALGFLILLGIVYFIFKMLGLA